MMLKFSPISAVYIFIFNSSFLFFLLDILYFILCFYTARRAKHLQPKEIFTQEHTFKEYWEKSLIFNSAEGLTSSA